MMELLGRVQELSEKKGLLLNAKKTNIMVLDKNRTDFSKNSTSVAKNLKKWGLPSASDPRAKNTGQRATKGTVLTSQSLSPWCDGRRLGSTLASWRWQDINVGNPL